MQQPIFSRAKFVISKALKKSRVPAIRDSFVHATSKIEAGSSFTESSIARHSFCGYDCDIFRASIGSFTSIASNVIIGGARHPMEWGGMSPAFYAGRDSIQAKLSTHPLPPTPQTIVGNDVWIGRSAIILSGVSIGDGAVVGAGAVVTKNVDPYSVVAGNPAKTIRMRFEPALVEQFLRLCWWELSDETISKAAVNIRNPHAFIESLKEFKVQPPTH